MCFICFQYSKNLEIVYMIYEKITWFLLLFQKITHQRYVSARIYWMMCFCKLVLFLCRTWFVCLFECLTFFSFNVWLFWFWSFLFSTFFLLLLSSHWIHFLLRSIASNNSKTQEKSYLWIQEWGCFICCFVTFTPVFVTEPTV